MTSTESSRLADFSRAVRDSTLKRLQAIPIGFENWQPASATMSVAGTAAHLRDADRWLFEKLKTPDLPSMTAQANASRPPARAAYDELLRELDQLGQQRAALLRQLTSDCLAAVMPDDRFGGTASVWWIIVRGNLDHEIHHRGQLAAYLTLIGEGFGNRR
jgi:uncharacterized damage-inducible protein DinB